MTSWQFVIIFASKRIKIVGFLFCNFTYCVDWVMIQLNIRLLFFSHVLSPFPSQHFLFAAPFINMVAHVPMATTLVEIYLKLTEALSFINF